MNSVSFPSAALNSALAVHWVLRPLGAMLEIVHLLHQLAVIFGVLFERMHIRKR
jgi:hypothetical protein